MFVRNVNKPKAQNNSVIAAQLIQGLNVIPKNWALTPVAGNKRPYRENWQTELPINRQNLIAMIKNDKPKGYGLRTGKWSGGILAIDADGDAAHKKLNQLGDLPPTVSFSSGKPGRCQYLVQVPEKYWPVLSTKKINTGVKGEDGKDQLLELRWNGCQSVLPPSAHPETGSYKWVNSPQDCAIAECPTWIIEYFLNEPTTTATTSSTLLTGDVPLYQCLTKVDRDLIDRGVGEGSRDDSGAKLARNLIGTAARLTHLGYRFEGDARQLFDDYCSRCSPPVPTRDAERIWKSAVKDNPTATLSDDALVNCIKAWQKNQNQGASPNKERAIASPASQPNNVVPHPAFVKQLLSGDELLKGIDLLIDAHIGGAQLQANLIDLAAKAGRNLNEVSQLYKSREQENDFSLERETASRQLPTLLEAQKARLSPHEVLWGDGGKLAHLIEATAKNMPVSPETLLTTLFPVAGSRIGPFSKLVINPSSGYTATSIFWTCVVSPTGTLKTPAQKVIISPLNKMESKEYKRWEQEMARYEEELQQCKKGDEKPLKPSPRNRFIVQGCTIETRIKLHMNNPRGFLYYRDEWVGFLTGQNKYRNGKGDDSQLELSEFNGDSLFRDVMDNNLYLEKSAISRTGNTQPEILKQFQAKQSFADYAGEFGRWLFCLVGNPLGFIDLFQEDDIGERLNNELSFLYELLGNLPKCDYFLNDDAKVIYQKYQHQLIRWLNAEDHPGLKATYPKLQTYLGRFALLLHLINSVLAGKNNPDQFVDGYTMEVACKVIDFYLAQARILYALNSDQQTLAGNLLKIKDYVQKHPEGVTTRQIKSGIHALRKVSTSDIELDCKTLVESLVITQVGNKYFPCPMVDAVEQPSTLHQNSQNPSKPDSSVNNFAIANKSVVAVDVVLINPQHPQTINCSGLQPFVDVVDEISNDSKNQGQNSIDIEVEPEKNCLEDLNINTHQQIYETTAQQEFNAVEQSSIPHQQTINTHQQLPEVTKMRGVNNVSQPSTSNLKPTADLKITSCPSYKVGDCVSARDPYEKKYAWKGIIKEISADGSQVLVYWPEREGKAGRTSEWHEASYLRLSADK